MVDKHRYSYSGGVRAAEVGKWGREIARARYGALKYENGAPPPEDRHAPQHPENKHGPNYMNRTPDDWRRGYGKSGVESAEGKPGYVGKK